MLMPKRLLMITLLLSLLMPVLLLGLQIWDGLRSHPASFAGLPRPQHWQPRQWTRVFDNPGFVVGYSEWRRNPRWVAYHLRAAAERADIGPRPGHFTIDQRSLVRVSADDYRRTGYQRGHMAPNYAMAKFFGRPAQLASFQMSNIVPQRPGLNQKLWQRLEELETDVMLPVTGSLYVVQGPIFDAQRAWLPGRVEIPDAFYRIWLRRRGEVLQVLAFVAPQDVAGTESLDIFITTVDEIEALTGLDFFHQLEDVQEAELEARLRPADWDLARHARHPPRY